MDALDSSSQSSALFRQKIALLIDFDNMILGIEDPGFDIEIVVNALRERGIMVLGRAYGDWYRHSRHRRRLMEQGIDLIETPVFGPIIKNSADMHMALDAFEIAHTQAHIDTFCIVSGDSDFLPLIKRLQTRDKNVIVIAGQKFTSELVRRNCNEYISYENLLAEVMSTHEDVTVIEGAYHLLARAIDTLHERGVEVRSSGLKQMMVQLNPMFSERTFACSQFRHFLDRAAKAGVVRMEGRDPHSGELLVSLIEEPEARTETRSDNRTDSRPDNRTSTRDSRLEPRDRFERFDRYEPRDNRNDARNERREADRREPSRAEPSRAEARSDAPRAENRSQPRVENRGEPRAEPVAEPAREEAPQTEEAVSGAEAVEVEAREGRRRRGGRSRTKNEAREAGAEEAAPLESAPQADAEGASEPLQVLESAPPDADQEPGSTGGEPEVAQFIDRNSQLGRVPLRRGRLRFSARLGRTVSTEEPEAQAWAPRSADEAMPEEMALQSPAAEPTEAQAPEEAAAEPQLFELPLAEATLESAPAGSQTPEAVAEAAPELVAELAAEAAPTGDAPEGAAQAKPKRRAPRRKSPRKKDAEAAPEAEAPAAEATPEAPAEAPAPEPAPQPSAPAEAVTKAVAEAVAEPVAEAAEGEASAKLKRPVRRRTRKKAGEAASSDAASEGSGGE